MKNKSSCMDEFDPNSLTVEQAKQRITNVVQAISATEIIPIRDSLKRVLSQNISSPIDVPGYTNSAMDGYALSASDLPQQGTKTLKLVGKVMAGQPLNKEIVTDECVRIMTGGQMPTGTDTVIMQEHVTVHDDTISFDANHSSGQNVRHIGEDIASGSTILPEGRIISASDVGLLASIGIATVEVIRRPKVAFFSTGDELISVGTPLKPGQIYDSNRYTLHSLLALFGAEIIDMGVIPDQQDKIEQAFLTASENADALITSGGVSVGEADFVKLTLEKLGLVDFWKIAMKPGRPLAFGKVNKCIFFGLPGNPVSAMVTFYQFVLPGLKQLSGQTNIEPLTLNAQCLTELHKRPGRMEYQRGKLQQNADGSLSVSTTGAQGSHILSSMSQSDCFIVLPIKCEKVEKNSMVTVQPFSSFFTV